MAPVARSDSRSCILEMGDGLNGEAIARVEAARRLVKSDFAAGLRALEKILEESSDSEERVRAFLAHATALLDREGVEDLIGARRDLAEVLRLVPEEDFDRRQEALYSVFLILEKAKKWIESDFKEGMRLLDGILAVAEDRREVIAACLCRGEWLYGIGKEEDLLRAQGDFKRVLGLSPEDWQKGQAYKFLALCYDGQEKKEEALQTFKEGYLACKSHTKLLCSYIECLLKYNELEQALEVCNLAVGHNSQFHRFHYLFARTLFLRKEYREALQECEIFLKGRGGTPPERLAMLQMAAIACEEEGNAQGASAYLRQANAIDTDMRGAIERSKKLLQLQPFPEMAAEKKLTVAQFFQERDPDEALQILGQMLEKPQDLSRLEHLKALMKRVKIFLAKGDFAAASIDLDEAEKLGNAYEVHIFRARICKSFEEADAHFRAAWEIYCEKEFRGDFPSLYLDFLKEKKEFERALEFCKEARERGVFHEGMYLYHQAKIYFASGEWPLVIETCEAWLKNYGDYEDPPKRLEVLDLAASACMKKEAPIDAYTYLSRAYELDDSLHAVERFKGLETLQETLKNDESFAVPFHPRVESQKIYRRVFDSAEKNPQMVLDYFRVFSAWRREDLVLRGSAYLALGQHELARKDLDQALRRYSLPTWKESLTDRKAALGIKQQRAEVLLLLARVCLKEDNLHQALACFDEGWKLDKSVEIAHGYVELHTKMRNFKEALKISREASKVFHQEDLLFHEAHIYFQGEQWKEALKACEAYFFYSVFSKKMLTMRDLAMALHLRVEQYKEAELQAYEAYEDEVDPSQFFARFEKLQEVAKLRIVDDHLRELVQNVQNHAELSHERKVVYLDRLSEAYSEEFAAHPSRHTDLLFLRGELCWKLQRFDEALANFEKTLEILERIPNWFLLQKVKVRSYIEHVRIEKEAS